MNQKFRAWDNKKKTMHTLEGIDYIKQRVYPTYRDTVRRYIPFKDANVMQYTGITDNKGIEIYEGDLVTFYELNEDREVVHCVNNGLVYFRFGAWVILYIENGVLTEELLYNVNSIIVGNFYENEELAEVYNPFVRL